jgi:pantoate--beta-alanine ligase
MQTIYKIQTLAPIIKHWKRSGLSIAFVPTMGNLHQGHLKLVEKAKSQADRVVVSIFVNPTQFCVGEDFGNYPRTEQQDISHLLTHEVNMLFLPSVAEMYQFEARTLVSVAELASLHCGATRSGHFDGVATVVCKLLNLIQPDIAWFGEKDFQQLLIIKTMVKDLNIPVRIQSVATVREADGLAMSSRNCYLTAEERLMASVLYQTLCQARDEVITGKLTFRQIELQQQQILQTASFAVDYFSICNAKTLLAAKPDDNDIVILAAAKLGKARLIDNIHFKSTCSKLIA